MNIKIDAGWIIVAAGCAVLLFGGFGKYIQSWTGGDASAGGAICLGLGLIFVAPLVGGFAKKPGA
jgi:hypothetical protein